MKEFSTRERLVIGLVLWLIKFIGKPIHNFYGHELDELLFKEEKCDKQRHVIDNLTSYKLNPDKEAGGIRGII